MEITVKKTYYNGIPTLVFNPKNTNGKLVFFQHGYTMNKEDGATNQCMHFASRGFTVVAIDAYGHGERKTKEFTNKNYFHEMLYFYEIIKNTTNDIINIYTQYFQKDFPVLNLSGESMGGMIIFMIGSKLNNIGGIASIVGSPSLIEYGYDDLKKNHNISSDYENMLDHLLEYDAFENIDNFTGVNMYFLCGTRDDVVPLKYSKSFIKELKKKTLKSTIKYKEIDADHWIPHQEVYSLYDWANNNFK